MTLDEFLTEVIGTIRRVGPPVAPTLFTWTSAGTNIVALTGERPVVLAHAMVERFNPTYLVLVGASLDGSPLIFFHAEGDGLSMDQVRDTDHDYVIVPGHVIVNPFERLMNARR